MDGNGSLDYKEFSAIVFGNRDLLKGQQVRRPAATPANYEQYDLDRINILGHRS